MNGPDPPAGVIVAEPFVPPLQVMPTMLDERVYVLPLTASVAAVLEPHALLAATVTFPEELPEVTLMEFVVEVPDQPEGRFHVYVVAPETAATEYVVELPLHNVAVPDIAPGCAGAVHVTSVTT